MQRTPITLLFSVALSLTTFLPLVRTQTSAIQSLPTLATFHSQRSCAQDCFRVDYDRISRVLGCPLVRNGTLESCFCRPDLQPVAEFHLSTCIKQECTKGGVVTNDIKTAVSIYDGYCDAKGFTVASRKPATTTAGNITSSGVATTSAVSASGVLAGAVSSSASSASEASATAAATTTQATNTASVAASTATTRPSAAGAVNVPVGLIFGLLLYVLAINIGV